MAIEKINNKPARVPWTLFFAGLALSLCAAAAPIQPPDAPPDPSDPANYKWEELADGVHALIAPPGITPMVAGNSLVVVGGDCVLVVDTGQFPAVAREEIAAIRRLTNLPVRYVVTTHWHPDHWAGNNEFARAWPGISFIGTAVTRELAQSEGAKYLSPDYAQTTLARVDRVLARNTGGDGKPLPPAERPFLQMARQQIARLQPELPSLAPVYPNVVFDNDLTLHLGTRTVKVKFLGRGNTGGDAVVYLPEAGILATGDLVVNPYPYGLGSYFGEWLTTLRRLSEMNFQVLMPGHGEIEHDKSYVLHLIRLLDKLQTEASNASRAGRSLEETRRIVTMADEKSELCSRSAFPKWCESGFQKYFIGPAIERSYREAREGPLKSED